MDKIKYYGIILLVLILFSSYGCVRARDYVGSRRGSVTLCVNIPLGSGKTGKDYLLLNKGSFYIDRGDSEKVVKSRLGIPSLTGKTLEGYDFWRYDRWGLEIYFDHGYVSGWHKVEFKP